MNDTARGVTAMIGACTIWGLSPLYYKLLAEVAPLEVLAHRTLWSLIFFAFVLLAQRRLTRLFQTLSDPGQVIRLAGSALFISANWFLFILSIQIERATEASLGYYIFPLVAVLFGVVAFRERLGRAQIVAVILAAVAVIVLSLQLGRPPWVSLALATSFGIYGVIKKGIATGAVVSVTAEVALLAPLALGWLAMLEAGPAGGVFADDTRTTVLLMVSGPLTAMPLILFSYASQRVALSTVGLLQYLNPTLQFLCATLVFREPFGTHQAAAFALIWTALAIYSTATLRQDRMRRRAAVRSATEGQSV